MGDAGATGADGATVVVVLVAVLGVVVMAVVTAFSGVGVAVALIPVVTDCSGDGVAVPPARVVTDFSDTGAAAVAALPDSVVGGPAVAVVGAATVPTVVGRCSTLGGTVVLGNAGGGGAVPLGEPPGLTGGAVCVAAGVRSAVGFCATGTASALFGAVPMEALDDITSVAQLPSGCTTPPTSSNNVPIQWCFICAIFFGTLTAYFSHYSVAA